MASDEQSDDSLSDQSNDTNCYSASENGTGRTFLGYDIFSAMHSDIRMAYERRVNSLMRNLPLLDPPARPVFRGARLRHDDDNNDDVVDEALLPTPPPEDLSYHFSDADLERDVELKFLSFVANACNDRSNWRRLLRKAKLDPATMFRLSQEYGNHVREYVYHLLLVWKQRHPQAKVRDLVGLLSDSLLEESAEQLKKYLNSIDWRD